MISDAERRLALRRAARTEGGGCAMISDAERRLALWNRGALPAFGGAMISDAERRLALEIWDYSMRRFAVQ